ncbi:START-like domain superfamily [Sesbania bispinosa]|nr:START-like domain superfamily [Sesbania bispinosa]
MEKVESSVSTSEQDSDDNKHPTQHHLVLPSGLTHDEFDSLVPFVTEYHTYLIGPGQCSSLLAQRIHAPPDSVWSVGAPETSMSSPACRRPPSTERLDLLDDDKRVTGFSIIGGEHRLRNYRSVTSVHGFDDGDGKIWTVVLESYIVDVPEGNTEEDTRLFADTVVKLNLQKLASVTEGKNGDGKSHSGSTST